MATALALLGLGVLILLHELGHLVAACRLGLPVLRFSIGLGPILWRRRAGGIEWAVSAVPFGGYVLFDAESPAWEEAPTWRKILTSLAGPAANALLAVALYVIAASLAEHRVAICTGLAQAGAALGQTLAVLGVLVSGGIGIGDLGGPVAMVSAGSAVARDAVRFAGYLGFLSFNLALFNLLPIPALDGGQILLAAATGATGRRLPQVVQVALVGGSFSLVLALIAWVTIQDVLRLL
jgi:regulator of sigma E protease